MLHGEESFKRHEPPLIQQLDMFCNGETEADLLISAFDFHRAEAFRKTLLKPQRHIAQVVGHKAMHILVVDHARCIHICCQDDEGHVRTAMEVSRSIAGLALIERLKRLECLV
jgi:hypothetical protein